MTRSGGYINGSHRGLTRDKCVCIVSGYRLAGTHHSRPCWSVHGSGLVCSGSANIRSTFALTGILEPQEAVPQPLTLLGEAKFIARGLRRLFLGECRQGSRHFLEMPSVSGLRPCVWTHRKRALAILIRLVGRKTNTDKYVCTISVRHWAGTHFTRLYWSVHGSGWVCPSSRGSRSRPSDIDSVKPAFMSGAPRLSSSSPRRPSLGL